MCGACRRAGGWRPGSRAQVLSASAFLGDRGFPDREIQNRIFDALNPGQRRTTARRLPRSTPAPLASPGITKAWPTTEAPKNWPIGNCPRPTIAVRVTRKSLTTAHTTRPRSSSGLLGILNEDRGGRYRSTRSDVPHGDAVRLAARGRIARPDVERSQEYQATSQFPAAISGEIEKRISALNPGSQIAAALGIRMPTIA